MRAIANSFFSFFTGLFLQRFFEANAPDYSIDSVYTDCSDEPLCVITTARWNKDAGHKHAQILSRALRLSGLDLMRFDMIQRTSLDYVCRGVTSFELELKKETHSDKCVLNICTKGEHCWPYVIRHDDHSAEEVYALLKDKIMGGENKIILT